MRESLIALSGRIKAGSRSETPRGWSFVNRMAQQLWQLPGTLLIGAARVYQWTLSPLGPAVPF
jgi:hypothetical protein